MKNDQHIKAVLYEVSLFLAENRHDYEARELHAKVTELMEDYDFLAVKEAAAMEHTERIVAKISNVK